MAFMNNKEIILYKTKNSEVITCSNYCCIRILFYNFYWKISIKTLINFKDYINNLLYQKESAQINGKVLISMKDDLLSALLEKIQVKELSILLEDTYLEIKRKEFEKLLYS